MPMHPDYRCATSWVEAFVAQTTNYYAFVMMMMMMMIGDILLRRRLHPHPLRHLPRRQSRMSCGSVSPSVSLVPTCSINVYWVHVTCVWP